MSASRNPLFKRSWFSWRRFFARPEAPRVATSPARSSGEAALVPPSLPVPSTILGPASASDKMPRPALRWLGPRASIALRSFDYSHDIEAVVAFQRDNYGLNFPEFTYSRDFEDAFRLDVRRASVDPNHAIYVLDEVGALGHAQAARVVGFVWLVVCENGWTSERYGYINNLYLLPEKRGLGLASEMMTQSEAFFRARRIRRVRLTVTASNARAAALYERAGFSTTRWEMEKDLF
jgi:ribosomal protein S18 acetylase RimI-like enzyme